MQPTDAATRPYPALILLVILSAAKDLLFLRTKKGHPKNSGTHSARCRTPGGRRSRRHRLWRRYAALAKERGVHSLLGLLATEEEAAIVRKLGLEVHQGFTDKLPLADQSASVVICNNVLLVAPREKIMPSLREFCRVAQPGARAYIGAIPLEPGPSPEPEFPTARETLGYIYRQHGLRARVGMLRRMLYWNLTGQSMLIRGGSTISFFAAPFEFAALGESAGMKLVHSWPHEDGLLTAKTTHFVRTSPPPQANPSLTESGASLAS